MFSRRARERCGVEARDAVAEGPEARIRNAVRKITRDREQVPLVDSGPAGGDDLLVRLHEHRRGRIGATVDVRDDDAAAPKLGSNWPLASWARSKRLRSTNAMSAITAKVATSRMAVERRRPRLSAGAR
jgi:hypothetical protein